MQTIKRAVSILREIGRQPAGLVDIATRVGLPTSSASRLLSTLEHEGAVRRDARGIYRIGPTIMALAGTTADVDLLSIARPHMVVLADELGEAVALSLPSGTTTTTIAQVDSPKPVRAEDWTGTVVPLHAGCMGLATLSFWPDDEIDAYLVGPLEQASDLTVTDPAEIRARIEELRSGGSIWTHGEFVEGLSSVAAPIFDELRQPIGALYTYGPTYRYPLPGTAGIGTAGWVATEVHRRADMISADLGSPDAVPAADTTPVAVDRVTS